MITYKTCIFIKRTCISIFSKIEFVDQSKPCTQINLPKICKLHKFATTNNILKKSLLLDMHHHKMYMYINFQQNHVKTQVMTVYTSLFAKKKSQVASKSTLSDLRIIVKRILCKSIFSKIGLVDRSKTVHTSLFAKNCKLLKFVTCNLNLKKSRLSDIHHPLRDIQVDFEMNRPTRQQITAKRNY